MIIEQSLPNPNFCDGCWVLSGKIWCNKYGKIIDWDDEGRLVRPEQCKCENSM